MPEGIVDIYQSKILPFPWADDGGAEMTKGEKEYEFAEAYPLRILIADSNYISRRMLRLMLEGLGFKIDSVENGQECLNAAIGANFDLILMEVDMPVMDGIEC